MGIKDFKDKKEYIFFILVLMFLEDKNKEEQFILSNITEYIEHNYASEKIEWTVFKNRKSLITVLKLCLDLGLIKKMMVMKMNLQKVSRVKFFMKAQEYQNIL